MRLGWALLAVAAAATVGFWAWLGAPVVMPPSPLMPGEKLFCVSYAPFRGAQNPLDPETLVTARQIEQDLEQLAKITNCVRTYSVDHGLDQVAAIAGKYGLKVMQGLWLSSHPEKNAYQIETVTALAARYPDVIRSVVVGNEVLLRGEMSATDLAATIRKVKAAVPVPVTYADVWEFWLRHAELGDAADFVTIHILPYWEDFPVPASQAAAHVDAIRARVASAFSGKEVLVGEVGWPSAGRMRDGARPSPATQAHVLHDVLAAAKRGGYHVNIIEAYDQPWKRQLEGTVGGYWGLFSDAPRTLKFTWGEPVSNHAGWRWQALIGVIMVAATFASAVWSASRSGLAPNPVVWAGVAAIAAVSGALLGWTVEKALLESLGLGGWLRSAALAVVAGAAPLLAAAALTRGDAVPSFAMILGGSDRRGVRPLVLALGACLVATASLTVMVLLGLVFDPRYRDFPFPALAGAVFPFLVLALRPRRRNGADPAERVAAAVTALSAIYVAFNESFANWQSLATAATALVLAVILLRGAAAPKPG